VTAPADNPISVAVTVDRKNRNLPIIELPLA
jgi:hypothetical protein